MGSEVEFRNHGRMRTGLVGGSVGIRGQVWLAFQLKDRQTRVVRKRKNNVTMMTTVELLSCSVGQGFERFIRDALDRDLYHIKRTIQAQEFRLTERNKMAELTTEWTEKKQDRWNTDSHTRVRLLTDDEVRVKVDEGSRFFRDAFEFATIDEYTWKDHTSTSYRTYQSVDHIQGKIHEGEKTLAKMQARIRRLT